MPLNQEPSRNSDIQAEALLNAIVPPSEQGRFHLEQHHEGIYSFRHEDTGRYVHMTSEGHFFNQKADPISQERAVSHALGQSLEENHQHKRRDTLDPSLGF